jgi:hypothetical protein
MKKIIVFCLGILLVTAVTACAMGPIFVGPKTAQWDPVSGATGYYLYWRTPGGSWDNTKRIITTATSVDMLAGGIPSGSWEICATAYDAVSESGPSNIVPWSNMIINGGNGPANLIKK